MRTLLIALVGLALAGSASAQGLGDVAARERSKRQAAAAAGEKRVYDNADLEVGRPAGEKKAADAAGEKPASSAGGSSAGEAVSPEEALRLRVQEAADGLRAAEEAARRLEDRQQELQDMLNPMSVRYVYGQATSGDARAQEQRVKDELAGLPERIEAARKLVVEAQKALAEARRPPVG